VLSDKVLHLLDASRWVLLCKRECLGEDVVGALRLCERAGEGIEVKHSVWRYYCPLNGEEVSSKTNDAEARVFIEMQQPTRHW